MQTVVYGNSITFTKSFINSVGNYVDPPIVKFSIVKTIDTVLYGPFAYNNDATPASFVAGFARFGLGVYSYTQLIEQVVVPGFYSAKWEALIDGVDQVFYEDFQVTEPIIDPSRIIDPPSLYGVIRETPIYNDLGLGATDTVVLIGHANGLPLNVPHRVINIQESLNILGADADSPLVRGMLEAYNTGAKDMWIVAAAPMSEYVPFTPSDDQARKTQRADLGGLNFYQRYSQRLDETYEMLRTQDFPEIVVPLEAPFYDSGDVDFLTPLLANCLQRYRLTGKVSIGVIGSRIPFGAENIADTLMNDRRISRTLNGKNIFSTKNLFTILKYHYGIDLFKNSSQSNILDGQDIGKFGMIVLGEGTINTPQINVQYSAPVATFAAALLATRKINEGIIYRKIPKVSSLVGYKFTKEEIKDLAHQRINVATFTPLGRRGNSYEVIIPTDNTLANGWPDSMPDDNTAFWSISTLRLIGKISQKIVGLGKRRLGTVEYALFQNSVKDYLESIRIRKIIRDFSVNIYRAQDENRTVYVDLVVHPFFTLREIYFTVKVGPGTGE